MGLSRTSIAAVLLASVVGLAAPAQAEVVEPGRVVMSEEFDSALSRTKVEAQGPWLLDGGTLRTVGAGTQAVRVRTLVPVVDVELEAGWRDGGRSGFSAEDRLRVELGGDLEAASVGARYAVDLYPSAFGRPNVVLRVARNGRSSVLAEATAAVSSPGADNRLRLRRLGDELRVDIDAGDGYRPVLAATDDSPGFAGRVGIRLDSTQPWDVALDRITVRRLVRP